MKKIITLFVLAAAVLSSCNKFPLENTAAVNLAGDWVCTVYTDDGSGNWAPIAGADFRTCNTAANVPTEIWVDDLGSFWEISCKVEADNGARTFGKSGKEYEDNYNGTGQMIWGGKVTPNGAKAPGTESVTDKIEFYMAFADDDLDGDKVDDPYCTVYCFVGYRRTGFPEDDGEAQTSWDSLPAMVNAAPTKTESQLD